MKYILLVVANILPVIVSSQNSPIQDLANHLDVTFSVLSNLDPGEYSQYQGEIILTYTGEDAIEDTSWKIYFCSIRLFEVPYLRNKSNDGVELGNSRIKVYHEVGCLHSLQPMDDFPGFFPDDPINLPFEASDWSIARTDVMPRWYIADSDWMSDSEALTIESTADEQLSFVTSFTTEEQWKRREEDLYNPFTPEQRFDLNIAGNDGPIPGAIIPTPTEQEIEDDVYVDIMTGDWVVVYTDETIMKEANFLAEKLDMAVVAANNTPTSRYVQVNLGQVNPSNNTEAYHLEVMSDSEIINITGNSAAGVYYAAQSLISLSHDPNGIIATIINDHPRFAYRGMHLDTSRNFVEKSAVLKLLDVMSMYKLNKFHFHLTDDEGWRLEIPGLPEATEIGSNRCHDPTEESCIMPQLGSGPGLSTSGSGYYSVQDYKEILEYANSRHIEVIPEFDMPGHGHAIIKAMEARYFKYIDTDIEKAKQYLLSDLNDTSEYESAQIYNDNAINPCIASTYTFVRHVIQEVKNMHQDIQPLQTFNYGGDEVPDGAWEQSPECMRLVEETPGLNLTKPELLRYFAIEVAKLAHDEGLHLSAWEDGLANGNDPYNRTQLPNEDVYAYAWSNVWEWGNGDRAYIFANNDYKVILCHATDLYFDHPQEPDPEERGYYWATRFTDTYQTFGYYPDDVYNNIEVTRFGEPLNKEEFCEPEDICIPLEDSKRSNVIGIQGHLWSETVRTEAQLDEMIFPRLVALAERAWHKGSWEDSADEEMRDADWTRFTNQLGHVELKRLHDLGVQYYIPPPGAKLEDSDGEYLLEMNSQFPGLPLVYSLDEGLTWSTYVDPVQIPTQTTVMLQVRSTDGSRGGRMVTMETPGVSAAKATLTFTRTNCIFGLLAVFLMMFLQ